MTVTTNSASETQLQTLQGILNVAAYKFVNLRNVQEHRRNLRELCHRLDLRGTILLSQEGINLFVAGEPGRVSEFLDHLRGKPEFTDLEAKLSYSEKVPFRRMLVRLKREIIPCGLSDIRPYDKTSPKLAARQLKHWLDQGRSLRLLDVRNKYEVELGTFRGAEHLGLGHFREFQESLQQLPEEAKSEPIVMFCTGGIRCEKAGPLMEQAGFREVYQLDGGILKYFEECGGDHFDGNCFVFDGRVALDSELRPTGNLLCFNCQAILTAEDVVSGKFMFGEYCPQCYRDPREKQRVNLERRQSEIRVIAASQPGSTPYDTVRKIHVPGRFAGMQLIDFLAAWQPAISRESWLAWIEVGEITNPRACAPDQKIREGECFLHHVSNNVEPKINPDITLIHEDESVVVVNKPAPLPCHPSGRFSRNTLLSIMAPAYQNEKLRTPHRLDANTTGVVLLCRKYRAAQFIQPQFISHDVEKIYLARVHGHPTWDSLSCDIGISDGASGAGGVRAADGEGLESKSSFRVLKRFADGTSLLEAIPLSGRTNQLRIHLSHLGHGIVGDPMYQTIEEGESRISEQRNASELAATDQTAIRPAARWPTLSVLDPPMCLHSLRLGFIHPDTGQRVSFDAPPPPWGHS